MVCFEHRTPGKITFPFGSESSLMHFSFGTQEAKRQLEEKRKSLLAMALTYEDWLEHTEERKKLMQVMVMTICRVRTRSCCYGMLFPLSLCHGPGEGGSERKREGGERGKGGRERERERERVSLWSGSVDATKRSSRGGLKISFVMLCQQSDLASCVTSTGTLSQL